jgi:SAM-dependent methyltransferase
VSLSRLRDHRAIWAGKAVLADVYRVWFDALLASVGPAARVLELGAGPGFLAEHARRLRPDLRWIASDWIAAPWNDVAADGLRLPVRDGCLDAVAALDFVHHLARPGAFFEEAGRVLVAGGRLSVVEPWVTPFSFPIYRFLHEEGCRLGLDPWSPFAAARSADKEPFQGDAAVPWRLVRDTPASRWAELGFEPPRVTVLNGFAYLASLGFRRASLAGRRLSAGLRWLDASAATLAPHVGMRALLCWDRRA